MSYYQNCHKLKEFTARIKNQEHVLLLAYGDSNTCNAQFTAGDKQWPELLHSELRDQYSSQSILMLNSGVSGDTALDGLERFETDVARFKPDCTIVRMGSNDSQRVSNDDFYNAMNLTLDKLEELNSLILLLTSSPVMECEPKPGHIWKQDVKRQEKMEIIRRIAEEKQCPFVDIDKHWQELEAAGKLPLETLMFDSVHSNALGHQLVCRTIAPAFDLQATFLWERSDKTNQNGTY